LKKKLRLSPKKTAIKIIGTKLEKLQNYRGEIENHL